MTGPSRLNLERRWLAQNIAESLRPIAGLDPHVALRWGTGLWRSQPAAITGPLARPQRVWLLLPFSLCTVQGQQDSEEPQYVDRVLSYQPVVDGLHSSEHGTQMDRYL